MTEPTDAMRDEARKWAEEHYPMLLREYEHDGKGEMFVSMLAECMVDAGKQERKLIAHALERTQRGDMMELLESDIDPSDATQIIAKVGLENVGAYIMGRDEAKTALEKALHAMQVFVSDFPVPPQKAGQVDHHDNMEKAKKFHVMKTIRTLHRYAAPVFFKPSIFEVFAQLPEWKHDLDLISAFRTEPSDKPLDSWTDIEHEAYQAGFHVAYTTLYALLNGNLLQKRE